MGLLLHGHGCNHGNCKDEQECGCGENANVVVWLVAMFVGLQVLLLGECHRNNIVVDNDLGFDFLQTFLRLIVR